MIINNSTLHAAFVGFKTAFNQGYAEAKMYADDIAMSVPSSAREETYAWLGQTPGLREWIGPRHVGGLASYSFTIKNRTFESTVAVPREDFQDDRYGLFGRYFSEMGYNTRRHKEQLIFGLLKDGFTGTGYDGQSFFDTDHPIVLNEAETLTVSNTQAGSDPAWFLLDTSRVVRPIIWQEREPYTFTSLTRESDHNVFFERQYLYGVHARVNCGYGLWQLAFGSKAALNEANYALARAAMMNLRADGGRLLGVMPTTLVVPPALEAAALHLLNTETKDGGGSNPWKGTAKLIVTPEVAE